MNGTLSDFIPLLDQQAAGFHALMIPIAAVIVIAGLMVSISRAGIDPGNYVRSVLGVGAVALAINFYPDWTNTVQDVGHGVVEELDADPGKGHERFALLVSGTTEDSDQNIGFFDVLFATDGGFGHAMLYVGIYLIAKVATAIQFLFFTLQQILYQFQVGLSPIFLAFFLCGPLRGVAVKFQLSLVSVLLWPLGWAIASLLTNALLELAATNRIYQIADDYFLASPQTHNFIIVIALWMLLSTIGAPLIIHKLLTTGANAGAILLSNAGLAISQGLLYGASAGATASMAGGSAALSTGAAAGAGIGGAVSGSLGSSGVTIPSAIGVGAALSMSSSSGAPVDHTAKAHELANNARTS